MKSAKILGILLVVVAITVSAGVASASGCGPKGNKTSCSPAMNCGTDMQAGPKAGNIGGRRHGGRGHGAQNCGQGMCDGAGNEQRLEMMAKKLGLTDKQQEAIKAIHEQAQAKNVDLRKEMARLRNEKQGEMLKDNPSEKTVLALVESMGEIRTQLQVNRMKTKLAVREELTQEQRDQMMMKNGRRGGGKRCR